MTSSIDTLAWEVIVGLGHLLLGDKELTPVQNDSTGGYWCDLFQILYDDNLNHSVFYHYYSRGFNVSFMFLRSTLRYMNGAVQIKSLSFATSMPFNLKDVVSRLVLNFHSVEHFSSQVLDDGRVWHSRPTETLTVGELFSFLQARTCPIASL